MTFPSKLFAVVIPMYNEEENAATCVKTLDHFLNSQDWPAEIFVVNDGSKDGTGKILREIKAEVPRLIIVEHRLNRGYGAANQTGSRAVYDAGYEYALFMDGDLTQNLESLKDFVQAMMSGTDVIKATRYSKGGRVVGVPLKRRIVSYVGNLIAKVVLRLPIRDYTNGYRAIKSRLLVRLQCQESGFSYLLEEMKLLSSIAESYDEIPYILTTRQSDFAGSKFTYQTSVFIKYLRQLFADPEVSMIMQSQCRSCHSHKVERVVDLGEMALAGGFLRHDQVGKEEYYPLALMFCANCLLLQVEKSINPEVLFKNYFYFSSTIKTLRDHFTEYASEVVSRFKLNSQSRFYEIGCNDGVMLRPMADAGLGHVIGIDPAKNVVSKIVDDRIRVVNDFFTASLANSMLKQHGPGDFIASNNAFAHIEEIADAAQGVATLLAPKGVFSFEVHYLGNLVAERQYDMIYHEHLFYYSALAANNLLKSVGMELFDLKYIPIHAGSVRFYASHIGAYEISADLKNAYAKEKEAGLDQIDTYRQMHNAIAEHRKAFRSFVQSYKTNGRKICGYGASGRANTMLQYCGLSSSDFDFIIDDSPAKQGLYTPGSHIPIVSKERLENSDIQGVVVFAWAFIEEISRKLSSFRYKGGDIIVPLPNPTVVEQ